MTVLNLTVPGPPAAPSPELLANPLPRPDDEQDP